MVSSRDYLLPVGYGYGIQWQVVTSFLLGAVTASSLFLALMSACALSTLTWPSGPNPWDQSPPHGEKWATKDTTFSAEAAATPNCFIAAYPTSGPSSDWNVVKRLPPLAPCAVQGLPIEQLEPELNFRRPYALRYDKDVEGKTHVLPFLRGAHDVRLHTRERRVLLDLGGKTFESSVLWFLQWYPLEFSEVHVFEARVGTFRTPKPTGIVEVEAAGTVNNRSRISEQLRHIPDYVLRRVHLHEGVFVSDSDSDGKGLREINITRFIVEELKLTSSDTLIVKMDIEGSEWPILRRWIVHPEMPLIIDELFIELHYHHPTMAAFFWNRFLPSRDNASQILEELRAHGFYVHPWP